MIRPPQDLLEMQLSGKALLHRASVDTIATFLDTSMFKYINTKIQKYTNTLMIHNSLVMHYCTALELKAIAAFHQTIW